MRSRIRTVGSKSQFAKEIMADEDIRKRSILKQTAAYLPDQVSETRPSYIHSQDFELFQFVDACHQFVRYMSHTECDYHSFQIR